MIVILKNGADQKKVSNLTEWLETQKITVSKVEGSFQTVLGLIGDTSKVDIDLIEGLDIVEKVKRISEPFKQANRKFHPDDTIIEVGGFKIGGGNFQFFAGPCSIETPEQITTIAKECKDAGANFLRGGAFKPRTSPYSFQGLRGQGLELMLEAKKQTGMPIVTEIMDANQLPLFDEVDIIQVGARNMQNFELLKALGKTDKVIFLKRGLAATIEEFLMSAEYIMSEGNQRVILCERGIRTYETATRNTLDISAVPVLHEKSHLPVVIDPSHATGYARFVKTMSFAAAACGADGLMIEVHNDPAHAWSDGPQAIKPDAFKEIVDGVAKIRKAISGNI
ncbi:MAG: 3-deoxy-7-phosphoheptulonate synthase [Candidatus Fimenecus sp.]